MDDELVIRPLTPEDRDWLVAVLSEAWASPRIVTRGRLIDASTLPGLVAEISGERTGLLTYLINQGECEIVSLNSTREGRGIATTLIARAAEIARRVGCRRLWLITSNDNLPALKFYQRRGFELVAVHRRAIEEGRRLKPEIAMTGLFGIPLRDEIELELNLV